MTVEVLPATGEAWDDVTAVFATTGDSGHCWCQWFHLGTRAWQQTPVEQRRAALERQVRGGVRAPGVIASVDGEPAGWCAVAPRASYVRLRASRKLAAAGVALDAADARALQAASVPGPVGGVWAVTCFVVHHRFRRTGVTTALLNGAVALARDGGADVVEGYPVDVARRGKIGHPELFVGTLTTFLAAGFTEVGRSADARPVVRLPVRRPRHA